MKKADIVAILNELPDVVDPEELLYRMYMKEQLDRAEADVAAGKILTHVEVVRIIESWFK